MDLTKFLFSSSWQTKLELALPSLAESCDRSLKSATFISFLPCLFNHFRLEPALLPITCEYYCKEAVTIIQVRLAK